MGEPMGARVLLGNLLLLVSLGSIRPFLMTPQSENPHSHTVLCKIPSLTSTMMEHPLWWICSFSQEAETWDICVDFYLGSHLPMNRRLGIGFWRPTGRHLNHLHLVDSLAQWHRCRLVFKGFLVSCPQPANAQRKARMETCATRCRVSACVSQG